MTERSPAGPDRRRFLCGLAAGGCAAAMMPLGCTISDVFTQAGSGSLTFDVNSGDFSALATVGQKIGVEVPTDADPALVVLIRRAENEIIALEAICPHTFCDMSGNLGTWDGGADQLICICHDSRFAPDGTLISGPSPRSIAAYPVEFDAASGQGTVTVGDTEEEAAALTGRGS